MLSHKNKIFNNIDELLIQVSQWKDNNEIIVFTNGCFDLIHLGHIEYLLEARNLGTKLIVGLNSDQSTSRLKGKHRPINNENTRLNILASFYFVDAVILFNEDTPYELIKKVIPNILVKGGDWDTKDIIGSDLVLANGGQVKSLSYLAGYSTTSIEQKIVASHK